MQGTYLIADGQRWWCCNFLRTTGHHWFWRQWRTLVTSVGLYLSHFPNTFYGDRKDDEGVMCWQKGCSSLYALLLLLCFLMSCCFDYCIWKKVLHRWRRRKLEMETKGRRWWQGRWLCIKSIIKSFILHMYLLFLFGFL